MDYAAFIGVCSFVCGFAVMFAIHRVVFDAYSERAENYIKKIKSGEIIDITEEVYAYDPSKDKNIQVEHIHTYATPDDVLDLKFNDYLED